MQTQPHQVCPINKSIVIFTPNQSRTTGKAWGTRRSTSTSDMQRGRPSLALVLRPDVPPIGLGTDFEHHRAKSIEGGKEQYPSHDTYNQRAATPSRRTE